MTPLPLSFYQSDDVVSIAKQLLGKGLFTEFEGKLTGGIILETEAYAGVTDRASHAYQGRRTIRNEAMYGPAGRSYVYLCYGIHSLLNAVTAKEGTPHAVLIRALHPTQGIEIMLSRRKKKHLDRTLCSGPGALTAALGITRECNALFLDKQPLMICDLGLSIDQRAIAESPRIGIDYAGPDAQLPYRFTIINPIAIMRE